MPQSAPHDLPFSRRAQILILLALAAVIYLGTASWPALLDDADASHALVSREMNASGDYVVLKLAGVRYLQKAPLHYWMVAGLYLLAFPRSGTVTLTFVLAVWFFASGIVSLVLALQCVHANIVEFGGDPRCVTIFGESGGAAKCAVLMAMPSAHGLFHRVWSLSGSGVTGMSRPQGTSSARSVLATLGLKENQFGELQTLPREKLVAAFGRNGLLELPTRESPGGRQELADLALERAHDHDRGHHQREPEEAQEDPAYQ